MKQSEIINLSDADLAEALQNTEQKVAELKMAHAIQPLDNPLQLRSVRRTVARVATELTKRELQ